MKMPILRATFLSTIVFAGLTGCKTHEAPATSGSVTVPPSSSVLAAGPRSAAAQLNPTQGSNAKGKVSFLKVENGIRVVAELTGLTPGKHGFHIHEKGDCSAPDAMSAGGHFNPYSTPHGGLNSDQRHVGDFGNLVADEKGNARADFVDVRITFEGLGSILGKAVIVHAQPDDLVSQPSGNAGARVACGVIEPVASR